MMIEYKIELAYPESHQFLVELSIENPDPQGQVVFLPAWIRGSYMIRDYARHITTIEAASDTGPVAGRKLDKQTWQFDPVDGSLRIRYRVYAWELSVRAAHFDMTHAYFNGPCLFLAVSSQQDQSCSLVIQPPIDPAFAAWRVATGLCPNKIDGHGFGSYQAQNYEDLIDHPFEIGEFTEHHFNVQDHHHRLVVSGMPSLDLENVCQHLQVICKVQAELFGELPAQNYLFMLRIVSEGYGGLEHRNSTSLIFTRSELFTANKLDISSGLRKLLALCSHEYFHQWHVKRITPEVFTRNGTTQEVHTRQLWIFEGITSYYDELMLVRSGVIDVRTYLGMLAETVTRVMRGHGRTKQTLEESSFDAWTKFYKQDENAPNALVSYYTKGALLALIIDLKIRLMTDGRQSLDDVMRYLWTHYGEPGRGLPEGEFEEILSQVTGVDLSELLQLGLRSTDDLPLASMLKSFGVDMILRQARNSEDQGGVISGDDSEIPTRRVLGAKLVDESRTIRIKAVFDEGAAQRAGLAAGDELVAIDGLRMNSKQLEDYLQGMAPDKVLCVHLFRRDELMALDIKPLDAPPDTCFFRLQERMDQEVSLRFNYWLSGHE
ncbi:MAG: PDZ domain-containing protein [Candidatus Thiodiazotropha sp.]